LGQRGVGGQKKGGGKTKKAEVELVEQIDTSTRGLGKKENWQRGRRKGVAVGGVQGLTKESGANGGDHEKRKKAIKPLERTRGGLWKDQKKVGRTRKEKKP